MARWCLANGRCVAENWPTYQLSEWVAPLCECIPAICYRCADQLSVVSQERERLHRFLSRGSINPVAFVRHRVGCHRVADAEKLQNPVVPVIYPKRLGCATF